MTTTYGLHVTPGGAGLVDLSDVRTEQTMTRNEMTIKLADMTDVALSDLLELLTTEDHVPNRAEKIDMTAAEIDRRPFASMLNHHGGETSRDPSAVGLALTRWMLFGERSPEWIERRRAKRETMVHG